LKGDSVKKALTKIKEKYRGDLSGVRGNLFGVRGNLDECEITDDERRNGININDLVDGT